MRDFMDLHFLRIKGVRQSSRGRFAIIVDATPCSEGPGRCTLCGGRLRGHGRKATTFRDVPHQGGSVAIVVDRSRFRCEDCGTTALQPVEEMDHRYRMTERMVERIRVEAVRIPFTAIAAHCHIHEKTVRRIVKERIPSLKRRVRDGGGPERNQEGDQEICAVESCPESNPNSTR